MKSLHEYEWLVSIIQTLMPGKFYWSAIANDCDVKLECRTFSTKQSAINKWKRFAKKNKITNFTIFGNIIVE
jgi:hypothetical protein